MAAGVTLLAAPIRTFAAQLGMVAIPNRRSSHSVATPVGGGLAFVVPATIAWFVLGLRDDDAVLVTIALTGLALSWIGFLDDRKRVSPVIRLGAQAAAALAISIMVLGDVGPWTYTLPLLALSTIGMTWSANLFNFMDGLDGLATTETLFVAGAGTVLWVSAGGDATIGLALACLTGAMLGFLPWNAPRARMFMGDTGSTWLGFTVAALALHASVRMPDLWSIWLILPALFVADATVCVVRRAARGENVMLGHRAHAYQNLSRLLGSHGKVVLLFAGANALLLMAAIYAAMHPESAATVVAAVYAAAAAAMVAGRSGVHGIAEPQALTRSGGA